MRSGGNENLNAFLKQYGIEKTTEIKLKYNSKAAEFYREKIRASVTGAAYSPPPPGTIFIVVHSTSTRSSAHIYCVSPERTTLELFFMPFSTRDFFRFSRLVCWKIRKPQHTNLARFFEPFSNALSISKMRYISTLSLSPDASNSGCAAPSPTPQYGAAMGGVSSHSGHMRGGSEAAFGGGGRKARGLFAISVLLLLLLCPYASPFLLRGQRWSLTKRWIPGQIPGYSIQRF